MWNSLPEFGTGVLYAVLVCAAYTFFISVVAGRTTNPRPLMAARLGAYGTISLIALGVLTLAYAFVTHDFRLRYIAHYSDRSMSTAYLLTALWGGQDGSLLWWLFLLSLYTGACVYWMRGKYRELQPYIIATLMTIIMFFGVLMLFAANPFWTSYGGSKLDGEGLNPLLQNFYMIIHPPSLYTGFVGCSVPFAFTVAALITGRLNTSEWIVAVRKWALFAWMFLTIGNGLGMLWAYEELGWGGYWAWDPVENAACLPWFTMSAFVHSAMIQERRQMLKVWNVVLLMLTFILTIFGTFLTRSGMIASVHSFAQSNIGTYFLYYIGFLIAFCVGVLVWRLPMLRSMGKIETVASREAVFVVNNWALLGMMSFIAIATVFPKLSELWWKQPLTVGPPFYNRWLVPAGLVVFALMGAGPLFGWRKTTHKSLLRAFTMPTIVLVIVATTHLLVGSKIGFPAIVANDPIYPGILGVILQKIGSTLPVLCVSLCAFNTAVIVQEFKQGIVARQRNTENENIFSSLFRLITKNRRRYGGYIVHFGVALMFLGFCGKSWEINKETSLSPHETFQVGSYKLTYEGSRMEVDQTKRMLFTDFTVKNLKGDTVGKVSPAKFIYMRTPESPTTEVAMMHTISNDLYAVVGSVNPETKIGTFQFHVNPLVSWVWLGVIVMVLGSVTAMWPDISLQEAGVWKYARAMGGVTTSILLSLAIAMTPARAYAQSSSLHAGTVEMHTPLEREIFGMLLCRCGTCARLPLSNCICSSAEQERATIRQDIASGVDKDQIFANYIAKYGTDSVSVPPNQGKFKTIWAVPLAIISLSGLGAVFMLRRWKNNNSSDLSPKEPKKVEKPSAADEELDRRLDEELRELDG
jgi:cytochrome c-type biogenesis protein CcmF